MASLKEIFPHTIDRVTANLSADEESWQLFWTLHGPDRRYNSRQVTILPVGHRYHSLCGSNECISLDRMEEHCSAAKVKLNLLLADPDLRDSQIDFPVADGVMVRLNRFRNGVYYSYHRLFSDEDEFKSLMTAFSWAKERGPVLIEKCRILSR